MNEENLVAETRQRVIAMIMEARTRIHVQSEKAVELRRQHDDSLGPDRLEQALEEIMTEAQAGSTQLIRDARDGVRGGWVVGFGGIGTPMRPWDKDLSAQGLAARDEMLGYIDTAERVIAVDLEELETGEPASTEAALDRDTAATEVASYEEQHAAPESVIRAKDRVSMSR